MTDSGTLATTAQVLLSIGEEASTAQVLEANTNIWILYAESEMEEAFGGIGATPELVANYGSITASYKQWLAVKAANRAAWHAINQDQNNWGLATSQSKLNVLDASWAGFLSTLKDNSSEIVTQLGL